MMVNKVLYQNKNILSLYKDLVLKLGNCSKEIFDTIFTHEIDYSIIELRDSYQTKFNELNIANNTPNNLSLQTSHINIDAKEKAHELALKLSNIASEYSNEISSDIKTLENKDSYLINMNSSLKSCDSICSKILRYSKQKDISLREAAMRINDIIRYTIILNLDDYKDSLERKLEDLTQSGYEIIEVENHWGNEDYQGINVTLKSPYEIRIEIQFHTLESYIVKEYLNHKYYEISRDYTSSNEERLLANKIMILNQKLIKVPNNIIEYDYNNNNKSKVYSKR